MRGQISVGSGLKIKRIATISDNAQVKRDLRLVKYAIGEGLLDQVITLSTYDRNNEGKIINRNITITELDEQILKNRKSKIESMEYSIYQMDLFSKYLKKNIHSGNGLDVGTIMNFIEIPDLYRLVQIVMNTIEESKEKFVEGEYNNIDASPQTLLDHVTNTIHNKHHLQNLENDT